MFQKLLKDCLEMAIDWCIILRGVSYVDSIL